MDLKDKIVVVTGSTRGFGYAIAESMLGAGATVVISGRTREAVDRALENLETRGRVIGFVLDVRQEKQVYKLIQDVVAQLGRIDVWVNNVGYSNAAGMMLDTDPQDALDMFVTNDLGLFYCTQAVMPGVRVIGFSPGMLLTDMLTSPSVVGERGREMLKDFAFVLRLLARPPKTAADALVKTITGNHSEFAEVRLFKPWTPLFGLLQIGWENLTKTAKPALFELHYRVPYRSKFLPLPAKSKLRS